MDSSQHFKHWSGNENREDWLLIPQYLLTVVMFFVGLLVVYPMISGGGHRGPYSIKAQLGIAVLLAAVTWAFFEFFSRLTRSQQMPKTTATSRPVTQQPEPIMAQVVEPPVVATLVSPQLPQYDAARVDPPQWSPPPVRRQPKPLPRYRDQT